MCRNYLPFKISGPHGNKVLPIYLQILNEHLKWVNSLNSDEMFQSLSTIIINNLEDFERKAKVENTSKASFTRIDFNDQFVLAYSILSDLPSHTLMSSTKHGGNSFQQLRVASFGLTIWIFPAGVGVALPIDEIAGAEVV